MSTSPERAKLCGQERSRNGFPRTGVIPNSGRGSGGGSRGRPVGRVEKLDRLRFEQDDHRVHGQGQTEGDAPKLQERQDEGHDPGPFALPEQADAGDDLGQAEEGQEGANPDSDDPQDLGRIKLGVRPTHLTPPQIVTKGRSDKTVFWGHPRSLSQAKRGNTVIM